MRIIKAVGLGVALTCILWVLGHLLAFLVFGYMLVGEQNSVILFAEIGLITLGLACFLIDLGDKK